MIVIERPCSKCGAPTRSDEEHKCAGKKQSPMPKVAPLNVRETVDTLREEVRLTTEKTEADRVKRWREKNRDHYNDYMRKRRKAQKEQG